MSRAQLRVIEHARIQSEIRRNNAEAEKMEAEAKYFDRLGIDEDKRIQSEIKKNDADTKKIEAEEKHIDSSLIRFIIKYGIAGIILVPAAIHLYLDTFKVLYDIKSYKIEYLESKKKEIERSHLELLVKDAVVNVYDAYTRLKMREDFLDKKGPFASERAEYSSLQATELLHEYWNLVTRISETKKELLPEVKQGIAAKECRTQFSPVRCKSLDLIERHVGEIHAGHSQFPDELIRTFLEQKEFQGLATMKTE